jgi:hypothetical protein
MGLEIVYGLGALALLTALIFGTCNITSEIDTRRRSAKRSPGSTTGTMKREFTASFPA